MRATYTSSSIDWELETRDDDAEVQIVRGADLGRGREDQVVRALKSFLVEVRRQALWKRRSWTTLARFSIAIRGATGLRFSRTWREPLSKVEGRFEEDSRWLGNLLEAKVHLVEARFWDRSGEYEQALRRTILEQGEGFRERCEDSLVEAAERLARVGGLKGIMRYKDRVKKEEAQRRVVGRPAEGVTLSRRATENWCMESVVEHGVAQSPKTATMGRAEEDAELKEARLGKKSEVGGTSNSSHVQMTESSGGVSIREPHVSSIKFVETQPEDEGPCLRVRTQVGAETSTGKESEAGDGGRRSGDDDQPMADAKGAEERKEEPTSPKSPRKRGPKKFEMKCTLEEIDTVAPLRRTLMQPMKCTLLEYLVDSKSAREELLSITKKVRVPLAGGPTVPGDGPAKEEVQSSRITMEELPVNFFSGEEEFYVLESGQLQAVPAEGVCHNLVIEVAGVEASVPIFSVKECSSELILGRTWLSVVHATTVDLPNGSRTLSIQSPNEIRVVLKTVVAQDERNRTSIPRRKEAQSKVCQVRLEEAPLANKEPPGDQLKVEDVGSRVVINGVGYEKEDEKEFGGYIRLSFLRGIPLAGGIKKYKTVKVAEKVKPAAVSWDRTGETSISKEEITDIIRKRKETEGQRITADRLANMDIGDENLMEKEKRNNDPKGLR
ncbi:hypothetical protein CBR_g52612 [Chara braunii]|uniref:Uncharacterized protein n=1 Tax=Chara braunii TaxID=69332 RepID=A0A388MAI0_CHABU|nr:hypothetical protein CBR_g52612 [Chara braunii]|eukprot:GBG91577.1 hypothetical protein CBR_g52612 [Chara braunii]